MSNQILVVGDIIIDSYLVGSAERISPEAPVPIININNEKLALGGAGNVVNNLLAFGAKVDLVSVIGNCTNASVLLNLLKEKNISTKFLIEEKERIASKKTRILSSNQQILRYDQEIIKDISTDSSNKLLELLEKNLSDYKIVVISDYGKGIMTKNLTSQLIKLANHKGVKVLVDPKGIDYSKYTGAYLLTPNKKEASLAINLKIDDNNLLDASRKLKNDYQLTYSIITLSHKGIAVFKNNLKIFPTSAKEVYDVTGAGDTVIAALAYMLSLNKTVEEAVKFANIAASIVVAKIGVATASLEEIYPKEHNIKSLEEIKDIINSLKKKHQKIVFTNGCFDILHLGHIKYLEEAKRLGDVLIVGVNTDTSVKKLKGSNRPINSELDRVYLINALKAVDYAILFNEETPYELIKCIEPDVLVKGADYKTEDVIGSDLVKSVHLIDLVEGKSTTKLISKINNDY